MTLEERAAEYAASHSTIYSKVSTKVAYIAGALDMEKLMIDKACDLMITMLNDGNIETRDIGAVNTIIRKELEV